MLAAKLITSPPARVLARRVAYEKRSLWLQSLFELDSWLDRHPRLMRAHHFIDLYFFSRPQDEPMPQFWVAREITGHIEINQEDMALTDLESGEIWQFPLEAGQLFELDWEQWDIAAMTLSQQISGEIAPTWRIRLGWEGQRLISISLEFFKMISIS